MILKSEKDFLKLKNRLIKSIRAMYKTRECTSKEWISKSGRGRSAVHKVLYGEETIRTGLTTLIQMSINSNMRIMIDGIDMTGYTVDQMFSTLYDILLTRVKTLLVNNKQLDFALKHGLNPNTISLMLSDKRPLLSIEKVLDYLVKINGSVKIEYKLPKQKGQRK